MDIVPCILNKTVNFLLIRGLFLSFEGWNMFLHLLMIYLDFLSIIIPFFILLSAVAHIYVNIVHIFVLLFLCMFRNFLVFINITFDHLDIPSNIVKLFEVNVWLRNLFSLSVVWLDQNAILRCFLDF